MKGGKYNHRNQEDHDNALEQSADNVGLHVLLLSR
jgi:hypothetical protein